MQRMSSFIILKIMKSDFTCKLNLFSLMKIHSIINILQFELTKTSENFYQRILNNELFSMQKRKDNDKFKYKIKHIVHH